MSRPSRSQAAWGASEDGGALGVLLVAWGPPPASAGLEGAVLAGVQDVEADEGAEVEAAVELGVGAGGE